MINYGARLLLSVRRALTISFVVVNDNCTVLISRKQDRNQPLMKTEIYRAFAVHLLISNCRKHALLLTLTQWTQKGFFFQTYFVLLPFFKVNQRSLGWALGFMINATNLLPVENPGTVSIHLIQSGVFLVVVIVGALLISTGVLICSLSAGRRYKQKRLRTQGLVL